MQGFACLSVPLIAAFQEAPPYSQVVQTMTSTFSVSELVAVCSAVIGGAATLVLAYWGIRKAIRVIWRAFSRGKLRF